jgi:hypothetical protein
MFGSCWYYLQAVGSYRSPLSALSHLPSTPELYYKVSLQRGLLYYTFGLVQEFFEISGARTA